MKATSKAITAAFFVAIAFAPTISLGQTVVESDFSQGSFADLGWQAKGDWDVFRYPDEAANNPGRVARLAANKPGGSLTKTFDEIKNPRYLSLSLDYGWGWGDVNQPADSVAWMLLDSQGNGYAFEVHRCKATWAVQWAKVANGIPAKDKTWAREETRGFVGSEAASRGLRQTAPPLSTPISSCIERPACGSVGG